MWVPVRIYKKSPASILGMIGGVILALCGIALITEGSNLLGILLILLGVILFSVAGIRASIKQNKHREKYFGRAEFVKKIQRSSLQAFYLYEKIPEPKILTYIQTHNPYAAEKIVQLNKQEMTLDEVIADLEAHDKNRRKGRSIH